MPSACRIFCAAALARQRFDALPRKDASPAARLLAPAPAPERRRVAPIFAVLLRDDLPPPPECAELPAVIFDAAPAAFHAMRKRQPPHAQAARETRRPRNAVCPR